MKSAQHRITLKQKQDVQILLLILQLAFLSYSLSDLGMSLWHTLLWVIGPKFVVARGHSSDLDALNTVVILTAGKGYFTALKMSQK